MCVCVCVWCSESELLLQLECAQTEVEFLRRRLKQTEERLEAEKGARELLDNKVLLHLTHTLRHT